MTTKISSKKKSYRICARSCNANRRNCFHWKMLKMKTLLWGIIYWKLKRWKNEIIMSKKNERKEWAKKNKKKQKDLKIFVPRERFERSLMFHLLNYCEVCWTLTFSVVNDCVCCGEDGFRVKNSLIVFLKVLLLLLLLLLLLGSADEDDLKCFETQTKNLFFFFSAFNISSLVISSSNVC